MPRQVSAPKPISQVTTTVPHQIGFDNPWIVSLALVFAVLVAYGPLLMSNPGFMLIDDLTYVVNNPHVREGLTTSNIAWALRASYAGNWHPLTWLSLQLDASLYGTNPTGFHFTNVLLHSANSVLLFLTLRRATRQKWPSAFVAGLFALHPLHVESVAWVAERKDVLSTFFWLLTMTTYVWYAEKPKLSRYIIVLASFALGLLAKQMLVTLPVILVLFDYWPLRRSATSWRLCLLEKLPLLGLALAAGVMTLRAQHLDQQILLANLPFWQRLLNAALAGVGYLGKTFWPFDLAPMYTRPVAALPVGAAIGASVLLLLVTLLALSEARRRPPVFVGWCWFLIALAPVSGVVQVGIQSMADRYTYVPHIGLFLMLVWGPLEWLTRICPRVWLIRGAAALLVACLAQTIRQSLLWQNDADLWEHAVQVTENNFGAHTNLGITYSDKRVDDAIEQFKTAIRLEPAYGIAHFQLGLALKKRKRFNDAADQFGDATRLFPQYIHGPAWAELAECRLYQGQFEAALEPLRQAARLHPDSLAAHFKLATVLLHRGLYDESAIHVNEVLRLQPDSVDGHDLSGMIAAVTGRPAEAMGQFRAAQALNRRGDAYAEFYLGWCLNALGQADAAREQYESARKRFPTWPEMAKREAWSLATHNEASYRNGSLGLLRAQVLSQALKDQDAAALDVLAAAHAELGQFDEAKSVGRRAADLARQAGQADLASRIEARIRGYQNRQPARE